jgi:SAM-dependent methyltransferase
MTSTTEAEAARPPAEHHGGPGAPRPTRAERIAAARPAYQAELASGTGQFFLPKRTECPWCGSPALRRRLSSGDHVQGKPGRFHLDQCTGCGHLFQNPRLNEAGLDFYYRDFYDGLGEETTAKMFAGKGSTKRFKLSARALRAHGDPSRWLDVGTSHGHFCVAAAEELPGTVFDGLDLSESVESAAAEGRISRAYRGLFTELAEEMAGRYEAVSMFHYLEHTLDPREELAAARTALKPGGHLMIEVPNPESLFGRVLGRWWVPWFQPQHLHLIPLGNLCKELSDNGFTVVSARRRDAHIPVDLLCASWFLFSRMLPADDGPWLPARPGRLARATRWALTVPAIPFFMAAYAADLLLGPVARRTALSNAYRVIARRD